MIFSTPAFLFLFLPPVLLMSLFLKSKAQNVFLLLASLIFYAWGEGWGVALLLASSVLNYGCGLAIDKMHSPGMRKITLAAGLGSNLALLVVFKYAGFIMANLGALLQAFGVTMATRIAWHQPLGISFFSFMAMAYLVEVYNRAIPTERNFLHTALYISFFPTVLAGPINRYSRLRQQMAERKITLELFSLGVRRFIIGLGKKVLLADTLARISDPIFAIPTSGLTASVAWLGAGGYMLQIFLDFSGYTDMAIGLGRMFGFSLMENFNFPYLSRSITDFWARWHISLSSWLRDFVFLPAAYAISRRIRSDRWLGIRTNSWCYYPAMLLTMLLCGLWHGAAWTFIAWGAYHGIFIMLERLSLKKRLKRLWPPLQTVYALLVVNFGWVLFRSRDFRQAAGFWRSMLGLGRGDGREYYPALFLDRETFFVVAVSCFVAAAGGLALKKWASRLQKKTAGEYCPWLAGAGHWLITALLVGLLLACAMRLAMATYNPFIYFRF